MSPTRATMLVVPGPTDVTTPWSETRAIFSSADDQTGAMSTFFSAESWTVQVSGMDVPAGPT